MNQQLQKYKEFVSAELKKQLSESEYMEVKPLIRNAASTNEVFELAKSRAKDMTLIRKSSLSINSAEWSREWAEEYHKLSQLVDELCKITGYWHIGSGKDAILKVVEEKGITSKQLEDILAPVHAADKDMDKAIDEALSKAKELGLPSMDRNKMTMSSSIQTRNDFEFGGKEGGSLFAKARLEGDYRYDLHICIKGKKHPTECREYKQLLKSELRGLINVNEEQWSEMFDAQKGSHTDGDYKYQWEKTEAFEDIGNKDFEVKK